MISYYLLSNGFEKVLAKLLLDKSFSPSFANIPSLLSHVVSYEYYKVK